MSMANALILAGLAFVAGGLFGARMQLRWVMRDLDRLLPPKEKHNG